MSTAAAHVLQLGPEWRVLLEDTDACIFRLEHVRSLGLFSAFLFSHSLYFSKRLKITNMEFNSELKILKK